MNDTTQVKVRNQIDVQDQTGTTVSSEIDRVIVGGISAITAFVGLWSVACLVSAMLQAGGPFKLVVGYFSALSGI